MVSNAIEPIRVNDRKYIQCFELLRAILNGFHKGFQMWICNNDCPFVPMQVPDYDFIQGLVDSFEQFHQGELQTFYMDHAARNRANQAMDLAKGGSKVFRKVRDTPPPPLNSVAWTEKVQVKRVAWPKTGLTRLPCIGTCNFKKHTPVTFQGQTVHIEDITPTILQVDHPVKLRSSDNLIISQDLISADSDMHQQLNHSWSKMWWSRDPHKVSL